MPDVEHLDASKNLVGETADWLARRVRRTQEGALSLAHVLVLAPTAQSARTLSLALARRFPGRGLVAPQIARESDLLDAQAPGCGRPASEAEETGALAAAILEDGAGRHKALFPRGGDLRDGADATPRWAVGAAGTLRGVQDILCDNALEVEDALAAAENERECAPFADDAARWRDICELYAKARAKLAAHGLETRARNRKRNAAAGCALAGVEEIVLPAAAGISGAMCKYLEASKQLVVTLLHAPEDDAGKFDKWGRPRAMFAAALRPRDIRRFPGAGDEARAIAALFRKTDDAREETPALVACDGETFPELEGAFGEERFADGAIALANPSPWPFARSPLGRLYSSLRQYAASGGAYRAFSSLVRSGDIARWAAKATGATPEQVAEATGVLDRLQNAHLPRTAQDAISLLEKEPGGNAARALCLEIARAVDANARDPDAFLGKLFAGTALDAAKRAHRELAAAAAALRKAREECESEAVEPRLRGALLDAALERATYQLEPDAKRVVRTGGWIEAQWKSETELVLAGFAEGCVPETTLSHAFVPESLRERLGLETNEMRAMRDSFLLAEAAASRPAGATRVYFHSLAADGSALKPSRILFEGIDDGELASLALRLYKTDGAGGGDARRAHGADGAPPEGWRLKPPFPPEEQTWPESISPSDIDRYLRCPFEYWMHKSFGEHSDDKAMELDARDFGTLCHNALEAFANSPLKDSADEKEIAEFLRGEVWRATCGGEYGATAIAKLQARAAIARLSGFARIQAARRTEGWRIAKAELKLDIAFAAGRYPTRVRGKIDRIDEHEETGELAIIDYKTWDGMKSGKEAASLQLPIYRRMLQAAPEAAGLFPDMEKRAGAKAFYCILGKTREETAFDTARACDGRGQHDADEAADRIIEAVSRGVFWPPSKKSRWREEYGRLVWKTPEDGIDAKWLEDQKARAAAWETELARRKRK